MATVMMGDIGEEITEIELEPLPPAEAPEEPPTVTPDKAVEAMSKYGGTVLKTSLSKEDEAELQAALHGTGEDAQ